MPYVQPSRSDVHVNAPLTNISIAFLQNASHFVADRAFPNIPVSKQSDRYFVYDRGEFNRDEMKERALSAESAGGTYKIDNTPTYFAKTWAFHRDIDDQLRGNADNPINLDREATEFLTHKALIRRERNWVTSYFTTGLWATDFAPTTKWDAANSVPVSEIRTARRTVLQSTGFAPNKAVVTRKVFDVLVDHPEIVNRINQGQTPGGPAIVTRQNLAALFELDEILVLDAIYNTAVEGATASHSFVAGPEGMLLIYSAPSPGLMTPSAGYTFSWTGYLGASPNGMRVKKFRVDTVNSDRVEIEQAFDQKLISADLGYFFSDVLT